MNQDRDIFYPGYSYGYMTPTNTNIPNNNYISTINQDITNRINRLERQIQRLEQRITRLETPYQNNNYKNEFFRFIRRY